jgi:hypothetical protein
MIRKELKGQSFLSSALDFISRRDEKIFHKNMMPLLSGEALQEADKRYR